MLPWKANIHIKGITPLLIHNGRTASPLDLYAKRMKEITSKRKKTEEDIRNLLMIQWEASLYWDKEIGLYMPTENMLACTLKACKKHKMGPQVAGFVFDESIGFPILTKNHDNFESLKADEENKFIKVVSVQKAKTLSCRAVFNAWEIKFSFYVDESIITFDEIKTVLSTMSQRVGLGVWTPSHPKPGNFGKFLIKKIEFNNEETGEKKVYENKEI